MGPTASLTIQLLFNRDILDVIFSFNSVYDATRCARVCKAFLDVALDHVWWEVRGFKTLFNVLAPLVPPGGRKPVDKPLIYARPIGANDWNRMDKFSRRVRSFTIGEEDGVGFTKDRLDDSVFLKALATRTTTDLLPNLQRLIVDTALCGFARVEVFLCVVTGRLRWMTMRVSNSSAVEDVVYFMKEVACRAPSIREIIFLDVWRCPVFSPFARDVFPRFRHLENLSLSSCALDAKMLSALSYAPALKRIKLIDWGGNGRTAAAKNIHMARLASSSQFRKLINLSLQSRMPDIIAFLSELHCLKNLTYLRLDSISASLGDDISDLLRTLASCCKNLKYLQITRNEDFSNNPTEVVGRKTITYVVLKHLCHLPSLHTFFLSHVQPLDISNQELASIIRSCGNLKHFGLHRDPSVCADGRSSLTLDFLDALSAPNSTSHLEDLLLEVDTNVIPQPRLQTADTWPLTIEKIDFGYSPLRRCEARKVAAYLNSVVSTSCMLSKDFLELMSGHKENSIGFVALDALERRKDVWCIVGESLELLCEARRRNVSGDALPSKRGFGS